MSEAIYVKPDFYQNAAVALNRLLPSQATLYFNADLRAGAPVVFSHPFDFFPEDFDEKISRHLYQHPAYFRVMAANGLVPPGKRLPEVRPKFLKDLDAGRAVRLCDAQSRKQMLAADYYNIVFKTLATEYQMGIYVANNEHAVEGVGLNRDRKDFTERERQMLDLLGPHYRRAFALHRAIAEKKQCAGLSKRQNEILHWVAAGKTNKEIAHILGINPLTVRTQLARIFQKCGLENRTAAALMYLEAQGKLTGC